MSWEGGGGPLRVWLACDWFIKYAVGLADGLLDAGCEVTLLTRDHDQEFGGREGEMRAFVATRLGGRVRHLQLRGRVSQPGGWRQALGLARERRRWAPDVVHVQDSLANDPRLGLASGLRSAPYALTIHDPVPHPGDAPPRLSTRLARRSLRRGADLVFVHSEELRRELLRAGGTSAPVEVVPHGVAPPVRDPLPSAPRLLFFGRISHYKGLDVLLEAMPLVWRSRPDVVLTVAGEAWPAPPEHPVLADPRVESRLEHVPEAALRDLFAAATCLVLPYRQASQSGVGSLAREFGRGVIATEVGGLPELVGADWGRLVAPEDPESLARAILELVETPGLAERMGRAAADSLREASWARVGEATVAAYRAHLL